MRKLTIAGASVNQTPFDWTNNTNNIKRAIIEAKDKGVDLICFSELAITGYGCEDVFLSEWLTATAFQELLTLASLCTDLTACIGLPVRIDNKTFNGVAVVQNEKIIGISLKQSLPGDGVHYEPRWFTPWKSGEVKSIDIFNHQVLVGDLTYTCKEVTFAFEICEDAWREIRPAQQHTTRGVELILSPSASHFAFGKNKVRESLMLTSSSKFNCTYLFVNQLGNEAGRIIYDGDILFTQKGKLLMNHPRLSFQSYRLLINELDFDREEKSALDLEHEIKNEDFAQAVSLALFDYLRKSKARGFVVSLSGGADSSICAVLVGEMVRRASKELGWDLFWEKLGFDNKEYPSTIPEAVYVLLTCAYQATRNSSQETELAASQLAASIGATYYSWSIEEEVNSYQAKIEHVLQRKLDWRTDDIAMQNIQARSRSPIIWMLANISKSILLTTSNRSEGDVGYATMDGDTSGSLALIAGVDKPFIIQWLKWAENELGYVGLKNVNALNPTAELRPSEMSQTDEKDLMPYSVLVQIEKLAIRDRLSPMQVFENLKHLFDEETLKEHIKKFFRLWSINQWKRERLAPSFHLDDLNVDPRSWCRFPILSGGFQKELDQL